MRKNNNFANKTDIHINFVKLFFNFFVITVVLLSILFVIPLLNAIVVAFVLAYILNPIVGFFETRNTHRIIGVLVIYFLIIILFWFSFVLIKNYFPTVQTISDITNTVIYALEDFRVVLSTRFEFINWNEIFDSITGNVSATQSLTSRIPGLLSGITGMSTQVTIVLFSLFFFLLSGGTMKKKIFSFVPNKYFEITVATVNDVDKIFGGYIRGTLIECLVIGLMTTAGFFIVGFPTATAIVSGSIAGLANAIPYIGPAFGGVIGGSIILFDLIPPNFTPAFGIEATIPGVIIVVSTVQFLDNFIKPAILGQSVNLHPMIVVLGIIIGSRLMGFVGMIIAIPIMAIIKVMIETLYKQLKGFGLLSDNLVSIYSTKVTLD